MFLELYTKAAADFFNYAIALGKRTGDEREGPKEGFFQSTFVKFRRDLKCIFTLIEPENLQTRKKSTKPVCVPRPVLPDCFLKNPFF